MLPESTIEKSAMLMKAMGWHQEEGVERGWIPDIHDAECDEVELPSLYELYGEWPIDLYQPVTMALAWRVLNWAYGCPTYESGALGLVPYGHILGELVFNPPAEAQAAWLDKVLELAIAAGLVTI